ncbi:hypothetical protein Gpo141_00010669 [Globisporangium polare]
MASTVDASAPPVTAAAVPVRPPKRRVVFRVVLNPSAPSEINFKELARSLADAAPPSTSSKDTNASNGTTDAALNGSAPGDEGDLSLVPTGPRSQRYNIIERLEKRYGGGAIVDCSESVGALDVGGASGGGGGGGGGGFERGEEDDYYDSEDSFIDDEELQQNIEDIHGQAKVKTKHAGFFVNAGDEIETIERDETDDIEDARSSKKNKKGGAESSKSVKGFLDEWSDAATDWSPEPEVITKLEILRNAVRELEQAAPITKVFPRILDDALRAVDILVVEAHPNKWRVNGYFATLMTFLPFTKQYLKSNMLRLEARDNARNVKDEMERVFQALSEQIAVYVKRAESDPVEQVKEAIAQDRDVAENLHHLLGVQDDWVNKENDYRQMLKTEDKKNLKEADYAALNSRQEKNRIFNRVLALFPAGLMDLPSLRGMNKSAKSKPSKKPVAQAKGGASAKTIPVAAAKRKTPSAAATAAAAPIPSPTTAVKRSGIKPFKSRMMDDAPVFVDQDFEEIE